MKKALQSLFNYFPAALRKDSYWITRLCVQRSLAAVYLVAFVIVTQQYLPLVGEEGLYPIKNFVSRLPSFWAAPSLFWRYHSDIVLITSGWIGVFLATLALSGVSERWGNFFSALIWGLLWLLYLSFVSFGQVFYGFGWESILLETGFLAIFLGARQSRPPVTIIWFLRWVLFRVMFGAGLIKIRGDECWRDFTCMIYHYETQPIPNPLSWFFHHLPPLVHKGEVLATHFIELVAPFGYFFPALLGIAAGLLTIFFQGVLILSGNLSWLNYMTIVLAIACLPDSFLKRIIHVRIPELLPTRTFRKGLLFSLTGLILFLSWGPVMNMFSSRQAMNASFDPLHLVNTYGAFGSVTRTRHEVILSATRDSVLSEETKWKEYEFKCKPGDVKRMPCLVSPYHLRLDWQIWFAAMSSHSRHPWILNLMAKLLKADPAVLRLLEGSPFGSGAPRFVRADLYEYRFTSPQERRDTKAWWKRKYVGSYLPPLSLDHAEFKSLLEKQNWA